MDLFDQLRKPGREGKDSAKKRKSVYDDKSARSSKSHDKKSGQSSKSPDKKFGNSSRKHGSNSGLSPNKHDGKSSQSVKSHDHKSGNSSKPRDGNNKHSSKKTEEKSAFSAKNHDHKSGNSSKKHGHKSGNSSKSDDLKLAKFNDKHKSRNSNYRRESMPSPVSICVITKSKSKKSRSLSPPKYAANAVLKSLKVKVERKNLDDYLKGPVKVRPNNIKSKHGKLKDIKEPKSQKSPIKATPTKAQQKLFEPMGSRKSKAQILRDFNIKKCAVKIRRDNFKKLMREFKKNRSNNKIQTKQPGARPLGRPRKRPAPSGNDESPPAKKGKVPPLKVKTNFFIKLSSPKMEKKSKTFPRTFSTNSVAHHNKIKNSKSLGITTPTKFSRSQLIRSFGKRFFTSFVRIEKCTHPLLLTFESNDRARRLQTKRNKSKNLSVSFREQVEVFGGGSDSDNSYDDNFCVVPQPTNRNGRRANASSVPLAIVPATPVVMPARLKKVENGKVVDDIELDPSLFLDPMNLVASTPYSPGRKKRDHKSFSPLKDEGSPSPRKEQLKLANERIPPSGLRRLNIDEDDDEDDDCEYIVPIELPQRRTSRTSSTNTLDGGPTLFPPVPAEVVPLIIPEIFPIHENDKEVEANKNATSTESETAAADFVAPLPIVTASPLLSNVAASPTPIVSISPTANVVASPITIADISDIPDIPHIPEIPDSPDVTEIPDSPDVPEIPDIPDPVNNPVTNAVIPLDSDAAMEELPQTNACTDDAESHDSFQSAKDLESLQKGNINNIDDRPTSLSPTSALNDVFDRVAASVIDSACETQQTQDITELNGTAGNLKNDLADDGVSINDMTMNLFIEDDSQADGDSPEKSFVDSIINETIDKLGKDIDEGSPVDEQYTHAT